jgi:hypothetical protein
MKSTKQKIIRFFLFLLAFLMVAIIALFFFRGTLLQKAIGKVQTKLKADYNCNFTVKEASFEGLSGLSMTDITLVPFQADTLLSIQKVKTKVNIFKLLAGEVQIDNLQLQNGFVQLVKNEKGSNFDAFLHSKSKDDTKTEARDYAERAYNLITKGLNLIPENIDLKNLSLRVHDMDKKMLLLSNQLSLKKHQLKTTVIVETNTFSQNWNINGLVDPRAKKADVQITSGDTTKVRLPYVDEKFKLPTSFDNLHLKIDNIDMDFGGKLHVDGYASVDNLTINNHRIASKDVVFEKASIDYKVLLGSRFIVLDSTSVAQLNEIKLKPYLEFNTEKDTVYTLQAKIKKMKAQGFINSLPKGLFSHFVGMQAEGDFDYNLDFKININKPWKMVFNSRFNKQNLKITKYGEANLGKLNSQFTYRAIDNGKAQRPVIVGRDNLFYTPLEEMSPYIKKCVLTSEDPSFMSHRGFITEAFRQSIIKNIRTKKFSRGASTISMQLIKNVFLTREKTLSRKLEEILLVYILENNRIASKDRMLEVYFNVIEWGPNIYGIGEAASFYFQKKPADLNLSECLFLASIVPKPKKFMYMFDAQGNLKSNAEKHQQFIGKIMFKRGLLVADDTIGLKVPINVSGRARSYMNLKVERDSIAADTLGFMSDN